MPLPGRVPKPVKLHRLRVGPHVGKPAVGGVLQVVRIAREVVAGDLEVALGVEPRDRAPEPDDVGVGEDEAEPLLEYLPEEVDAAPHHFQVPVGHEVLLAREVDAVRGHGQAVRVDLLAPAVGGVVEGYDDEVV